MSRVAVAFFYHESHSFSPLRTGLDAFAAEDHHRGEAMLAHYRGTRTELGGFLEVLERLGHEPVPLIAAAAMPAGPVTAAAHADLREEMLSALAAAGPVDGLLLALHGAMVAEDERDPEGALLLAIRESVGPGLPIAMTMDLHANLSEVAAGAALLFGYQTYPHTDMYEQGQRAANALAEVLSGTELSQCTIRLPLLLPSINMRTAAGPMADVVALAAERERGGVRAVTALAGFPYADTECSGASVTVVADQPGAAEAVCREVADFFWEQRERFWQRVDDIPTALDRWRASTAPRPIVLADIADNPQSGGSADTTMLLRAVLEADADGALFGALCDPEVLAASRLAGPGGRYEGPLGGRCSPEFGDPVAIRATVLAVSDGVFVNDGPFNAGLRVDVGGAAWLRLDGGAGDVLLTGRPVTANDPQLFAHLGIDPEGYALLVFKVKNHFRAAFEPLVGEIIPVDAPGVAQTDFTEFRFRHTDRSSWPFDRERPRGPVTALTSVVGTRGGADHGRS